MDKHNNKEEVENEENSNKNKTMTNQDKAQEIANKFDFLTHSVRVFLLTRRNKEGGRSENPDRQAYKRISKEKGEFVPCLTHLLDKFSEGERIYCTVNSRDMKKAVRNFKERQLAADYYDKDSFWSFYLDIYNRWISSLMKNSARAETRFLIDIDDDQYIDKGILLQDLAINKVEVVADYPTKNGSHIITQAYAYPKITPYIKKDEHLKVDGLSLLYYG